MLIAGAERRNKWHPHLLKGITYYFRNFLLAPILFLYCFTVITRATIGKKVTFLTRKGLLTTNSLILPNNSLYKILSLVQNTMQMQERKKKRLFFFAAQTNYFHKHLWSHFTLKLFLDVEKMIDQY